MRRVAAGPKGMTLEAAAAESSEQAGHASHAHAPARKAADQSLPQTSESLGQDGEAAANVETIS